MSVHSKVTLDHHSRTVASAWVLQRTKVVLEEGEGGDVDAKREDLGNDHQPVPGAHCQPHHQQLRQDQRWEGDGHHVDELFFK